MTHVTRLQDAAMDHDYYGLNALRLIGGFGGGLVNALIFRKSHPMEVLSTAVTGTLVANFLGPAASHYAPSWVGDGGVAFLVGLSAMAICQGAVSTIRARLGVPPSDMERRP